MNDTNLKTKVVHSRSKPAWNVVGTSLGAKHMVAKVPYEVGKYGDTLEYLKGEAKEHADFISHCFNRSADICVAVKKQPK
ncbi:hypothetical protein LEM8419_03583 [Neolewinella maritima]|uniref:Uncharacterized protein n=1 Tax=Neolewinella maritima TaxID=1383882 RepID=A0ABN8F9H9_9BACT|nr:hypothetical protein [Neolewinella maritima]CAH1002711.1 hypothetical protein LEM8419_03583 [Neolewinella maritima]